MDTKVFKQTDNEIIKIIYRKSKPFPFLILLRTLKVIHDPIQLDFLNGDFTQYHDRNNIILTTFRTIQKVDGPGLV